MAIDDHQRFGWNERFSNRWPSRSTWLSVLFVCGAMLVGCGPQEQELGSATDHFLAAQDALANNDTETALRELTSSIEVQPDPWAYYQRARIYTDKGEDEKAMADCQAGLALDPEHVEMKWLQGELKKPAGSRFQGRNKEPPVIK